MKKLLLLFTCFLTLISTAQNNRTTDPKNELSLHLKESVNRKLLKNLNYYPGSSFIKASFCVDKNNEIYNFTTTNRNKELNVAIENAFNNYPIQKLLSSKPDPGKKYNLHIISKKGAKNIFNCSNQVEVEKPIQTKSCQKIIQYPDIKKCFSNEVKEHFSCNFNSEHLPNQFIQSLSVSYKVSNRGTLLRKSKSKSKAYEQEIDRVFKLFKPLIIPASINGILTTNSGSFHILIGINQGITCAFATFGTPTTDNNPLSAEINKNFQKFSAPEPSNELSLFLKEHLSQELLSKTNLNEINNSLKLHFSFDTKNNYTNISTNARSKTVEEALISIFKKYPVEQLNLKDSYPTNRYTLQLLSFENNTVIVNASSEILYERIPIFKSCEKSKTAEEGKKCFSYNISKHINRKFNSSLAKSLDLSPGKKRIYCMFKISSDGTVKDIQVRAPHPALKKETIRVVQTIPRMTPGIQNGKPVSVRYSLPIAFMIAEPASNSSSQFKTNKHPASSF